MSEPMEALQSWQEWYKKNQPEVSSDTIFQLMKQTERTKKIENEVLEWMGDTLAQGLCELSGSRLYELIIQSVKENLEYTKEEYLKVLELYQLLTGHSTDENNG